MNDPKYMFWDSCVFYRYLTCKPTDHLHDIEDFIKDAREGNREIHCSTVSFVEIRQSALKQRGHGSISEFFVGMKRAFHPFDPNPNIMIIAGQLRDAEAVNPARDASAKSRIVGTADAIHLATCLYLRDVIGLNDIVFHTFDEGKGKTWEGKCVPLLKLEEWFPKEKRTPAIQQVCDLTRCKPVHPVPNLLTGPPQDASGPQ